MLSETGQEVPGWLANFAARHAPYGQKSRRGGGRFGGRDFRKDFGGHANCEYSCPTAWLLLVQSTVSVTVCSNIPAHLLIRRPTHSPWIHAGSCAFGMCCLVSVGQPAAHLCSHLVLQQP